MPLLQRQSYTIALEIMTFMSNYIPHKATDVITYPRSYLKWFVLAMGSKGVFQFTEHTRIVIRGLLNGFIYGWEYDS